MTNEAKFTPEYEVTKEGRVYSISTNWRGYGKRELSQTLNSHGYPSVRIIINGIRKRFPTHKLVAAKYLSPKPSPKHQIRHLDGNKLNSNADNLTWGTAKENAKDRDRHGTTPCGENHGIAIRSGWAKRRRLISSAIDLYELTLLLRQIVEDQINIADTVAEISEWRVIQDSIDAVIDKATIGDKHG